MVLEARVQALEELKAQIASERDDLRGERDRLLGVIEEQAGSVKQLTYQPKPAPTTSATGTTTSFWKKLFRGR